MTRLFVSFLCILLSGGAFPQSDERLILTSVGPVHQLARTLTEDTDITVENIPERPRSLAAQPSFFMRQGERFTGRFRQAQAVITIGRLWSRDVFYTTAREASIRMVNIDATRPWSHTFTGVAVAESPVTGEVSPYFWTSPSNIIQSLNIIARDLQALFPDQRETIAANLSEEREYYVDLKADFEASFLEVADPVVYALADEFVYLTRDLGIFVEDYFIKQDIDWTEEDLVNLTETLEQSDIPVVIHKWEPSEEIRAAIDAGGARLVVLNLMETDTSGFREGVRFNLDGLLEAMLPTSQ